MLQLTDAWDALYRTNDSAWEGPETAPATRQLVLENVPVGRAVLDLGCGRGVDSVWLAEMGYRVTGCDVSRTAVQHARARAREHGPPIDFYVADVLRDQSLLPCCDAVFERGVLHTFVTDDGRSLFARAVANLLEPGQLWLCLAGIAATKQDAEAAAMRREARISASQIAVAVEPYFDIISMTRTRYGFAGGKTDFDAFASAFRRRQ